jgi:hypothetical protein
MKHLFYKLAFVIPAIFFSGCTVTPTYQEEVVVGGEPHYDLWPTSGFLLGNWAYYNHHHDHDHHHDHGHHHDRHHVEHHGLKNKGQGLKNRAANRPKVSHRAGRGGGQALKRGGRGGGGGISRGGRGGGGRRR